MKFRVPLWPFKMGASGYRDKQTKKIPNEIKVCNFDKNLILMDLQTRKMEFVREFMEFRNEETISRLEQLLRKEKVTATEDQEFMSEEELDRRIDRSEADFEAGRFKTSSELLKRYR